jgi:Ca2+-binding RTX toxin-like protein
VIDGRGDGATDYLNGGAGDDVLLLGAGDVAGGGDGSDHFQLSDGSQDDPVARIDDFDASTDQIVVVYDPADHPDPQLSVAPTEDGQGSVVMLDGIPVAELPGVEHVDLSSILLQTQMPTAA